MTPAKLHRIELTAPLKGEPYWVKDTCRQLGIHSVVSRAAGPQSSVTSPPASLSDLLSYVFCLTCALQMCSLSNNFDQNHNSHAVWMVPNK